MISAQLKNTPTAPANDVCVDQFQVVPTPLFKQDKRHTKAAGNQYVNKDLISFYRPLVKNIVNRMMVRLPSHVDAEDLYSVGLMALITASKRYTHQNRDTFKAYVKTRVRGAVYDELRRLDCLPRSARAKVRKLQDTANELEQKLGRAPTDNEICETLQLSQHQYTRMVRRTRPISLVSLDATIPGKDDEHQSLHEVIADENAQESSDEFARRELVSLLAEKIEAMPEKHRQVLAMYYFEGLRISEIAKVFKITEARVCQIQTYALSRLRKYANSVLSK
jgi:RNA polymerase sigma factor for flagellar operon FliA